MSCWCRIRAGFTLQCISTAPSRGAISAQTFRIWVENLRYKDGTTKSHLLAFSPVPYKELQSDRCLAITTFCNLFAPFHGGNTGSNPVGDANKIKEFREPAVFLHDPI
jgi:hypothetical protein